MADIINPDVDAMLSNEALDRAYDGITSLMDEYDIRATFAFVGMLTLSPQDVKQGSIELPSTVTRISKWNEHFYRAFDANNFDGWLNPRLLEIVRASGKHEIASHGFSHYPMSAKTPAEDFDAEMRAMHSLMSDQGMEVCSLIYPRNAIGHIQRLDSFGVTGYREGFELTDRLSRFKNLATEFRNARVEHCSVPNGSVAPIPEGHFLNWRSGLRRAVPFQITVKRWRNLIRAATHQNGLIHLWTHPHNFVTGSGQFMLLRQVFELVAQATQVDMVKVKTMKELSEGLLTKQGV